MNFLAGCAVGGDCAATNTGYIIGIILGVILLLVIAYFIFKHVRKKHNK